MSTRFAHCSFATPHAATPAPTTDCPHTRTPRTPTPHTHAFTTRTHLRPGHVHSRGYLKLAPAHASACRHLQVHYATTFATIPQTAHYLQPPPALVLQTRALKTRGDIATPSVTTRIPSIFQTLSLPTTFNFSHPWLKTRFAPSSPSTYSY